MSADERAVVRLQRGMGLIEVMISVVIGLLLVLVIYQIYEVSEGQKRTITAGSDAQQNASYGLYVMARDIAIAGNGIASAATAMKDCPFDVAAPEQSLAPIPVMITAGATANDPDAVAVFYGGSSSLSTPVPFKFPALAGSTEYVVAGPVGFSADPSDTDKSDVSDTDKSDVIVAVEGATCTLSTIEPGGVDVDASSGFARLTHRRLVGDVAAPYSRDALLVNLGQRKTMGRIAYTVDPATHALRTQRFLPTIDQPSPVVSDVINLKAQYGLDTTDDGIVAIDTWQDATGAWTAASLAALTADNRLKLLRQVLAVRVAIVTRSTQWEFDRDTRQCIVLTPGPIKLLDDTTSMNLIGDEKCYRYKVLETVVPLRNALWNTP